MCFNESVSLSVGLFGVLSSFYLIYRGVTFQLKQDILAGVLLFFISLMQFIEYILWKNQNCNLKNQIASILIIVVLFLQVISTNITYFYLFGNSLKEYFLSNYDSILLIIFTLLIIYIVKILYDNKSQICSFKDEGSCRLAWEPFRYLIKNYTILSIICIGLYFYLMNRPTSIDGRRYLLLVTLIIALIYSTYYQGEYFLTIFGGVWCFMCVGYGIVSILDI